MGMQTFGNKVEVTSKVREAGGGNNITMPLPECFTHFQSLLILLL